jgi:predicted O-methyltransferase YrrM
MPSDSAHSPSLTIQDVLAEASRMPQDWHGAGSLSGEVLAAIARHAASRPIRRSVETGTGKSTLVLSHCSDAHTVFAQDDRGHGDSLMRVQECALLRRETTTFVVGPTQRTLAAHRFDEPIDLVMLDGPHGYPFPELEYYFIYPHLPEGAILIVDDIHIPTVFNMFTFLREDAMYRLAEVVQTTAFFVRTAAPLFDPLADGWWLQKYNERRYPITDKSMPLSLTNRLKRMVPARVRLLARQWREPRAR